MLKWFLVCIILKLGDIGTTYYIISNYGLNHESNPVVKWQIDALGIEMGLIFNFLIFFIILLYVLCNKFGTVLIFKICFAILLLTVINNSIVIAALMYF